MLDEDLAELYGVETRRLNEKVKRNPDRFPVDFMFQLSEKEFENLKSQNATSSWGGRRKLPYAFSEHGVLMLSSVLNSPTAIQVNIKIMRVYTKLREMILANKDILLKLEHLEKKILQQDEKTNKHEEVIQIIFSALKQLFKPTSRNKKKNRIQKKIRGSVGRRIHMMPLILIKSSRFRFDNWDVAGTYRQ